MAKFKFKLSIGYTGATHEKVVEIPDAKLEDCDSDDSREDVIGEYWTDWANKYVESSWEPVQ